ncbi:hypothetical protein SBC2_06200 [Caballeronia sp. SBC2]|nr:hypothetical protein SBC2_06200 [Caballeronia sp. SBC2]
MVIHVDRINTPCYQIGNRVTPLVLGLGHCGRAMPFTCCGIRRRYEK